MFRVERVIQNLGVRRALRRETSDWLAATSEGSWRRGLVQNTACPKEIAATTIMIAIMIAPINRIFAIPAVAADTPENPKNPATMEIRKNISAHFNISPLPAAALSQPAGVELVPNAWETFGADPWPACLLSASSLAIVEVFQARSRESNLTPALAKGGRMAHLNPRRPSAT
jgi:hypothetical protein